MSDTRAPRNRSHPAPRPRRARVGVKGLLAAASSLAAAVVLAVGAAGGTYAYLNDGATLNGATVTAGTASLSVSPSSIALSGLYPGATRYAAVTVTNTGDVPLQLRVDSLAGPAAATAFSSSLTVGVGVAANAAACTSGATASTWTGAFASAVQGDLGSIVLATGGTATLCVATTMSASAAPGAQSSSAGFVLTLGGRQV